MHAMIHRLEVGGTEARFSSCSGHMSPEYAFDGKFSMKSDVFGFGVLLLEIVSGKRNRGFWHLDHHHNLLGQVSSALFLFFFIC